MYKFPLKSDNLSILQRFSLTHDGVDIACGTAEQTWGKECLWTLPYPGVVYTAEVDSQFDAQTHSHSQIDTTDPNTGIKYSVIYLHLSSVTQTKKATEDKIIIYNNGDVIGRIGNNGSVTPKPTLDKPYNGSHLHLGLGIKKPGELNYTQVDPLLYFEIEEKPSDKLTAIGNKMMATNPVQARIVLAVAGVLRAFGS